MSLPVNDELLADRYELAEIMGIGGMATVYRAWDTHLRRPVAIKLFSPTADLDDARRFDNEVRVLASLSHPGLVPVYDSGTTDHTPFVVLQLIDGQTLRHRINEGPMPVDDMRTLGAALADALAYVHDHDVVHRDVKPSNVLLDDKGRPHLADFGLAHLAGSTRLTRTGLMVGTAAYLAPEQVRGAEVGSAADVYALGLVLLECLTGMCEYTGSDIEVAVARLHRSPVIPADLPDDLIRLLSLMTSPSPHHRPTAHQCAHVLRTGQATALTSSEISPESTPAHLPARHLRRVPSKAVAATAAGVLAAIGIAWSTSSAPIPPTSEPQETVRQAVVQTATSAPDLTAQPAAAPASTTGPTSAEVVPHPIDTTTQPAIVQEQAPAQQAAPAQEQVVEHEQASDQSSGSGRDQAPGQNKKDKPVPPGQAKKIKP